MGQSRPRLQLGSPRFRWLGTIVLAIGLGACTATPTAAPSPSGGPSPVGRSPAASAAAAQPATPGNDGNTIDAAGGTVLVPPSDALPGGLSIVVPPGAVSGRVEISATAGATTSMAASVAAEPRLFVAVADYLASVLPPEALHPVFGAYAAVASAGPPVASLRLAPDGVSFAAPLDVIVPGLSPSDAGDDLLVAAFRSSDGTWSAGPVRVGADGIHVAVSHFSGLSVWRILRHIAANPFAEVDRETLAAAQLYLAGAPLAATERSLLARIACEEAGTASVDWSALPTSLTAVVNYLGRDEGEIAADPTAALKALDGYVDARRDAEVAAGVKKPAHFVTMDDLFAEAMRLAKSDVFRALVLVHGALRDNRSQQGQLGNPFQDALELLRGDNGDEDGARYHYFGTAIYSFVYAYQAETGALSMVNLSPETTVRAEEGWVSGDIRSDTVEYAVDLQGAEFGRTLYDHLRARAPGRSSRLAGTCSGMTGTVDLVAMSQGSTDMAQLRKMVTQNRLALSIEIPEQEPGAGLRVHGSIAFTLTLPGELMYAMHSGVGERVFGVSPPPMPPAWNDCTSTATFRVRLTGTLKGGGYRGTAVVATESSVTGCEDTGSNLRATKPTMRSAVPWSGTGDRFTMRGTIKVGTSGSGSTWLFDASGT